MTTKIEREVDARRGIGARHGARPAWADWPLARIIGSSPPLVMPGWTPLAWAAHLRGLAGRCEKLHADASTHYRAWAERLDSSTKVR